MQILFVSISISISSNYIIIISNYYQKESFSPTDFIIKLKTPKTFHPENYGNEEKFINQTEQKFQTIFPKKNLMHFPIESLLQKLCQDKLFLIKLWKRIIYARKFSLSLHFFTTIIHEEQKQNFYKWKSHNHDDALNKNSLNNFSLSHF